jgi:hypothetical protein
MCYIFVYSYERFVNIRTQDGSDWRAFSKRAHFKIFIADDFRFLVVKPDRISFHFCYLRKSARFAKARQYNRILLRFINPKFLIFHIALLLHTKKIKIHSRTKNSYTCFLDCRNIFD